MHFKFTVFFLLLLIFSSCKRNSSGIVEQNSTESLSINQNDQDLLLEFIKKTSFDFSGFDKNDINLTEDSYENNILLLRVFIDTDGTGTLGWIQIDFNKAEVRDITQDPDQPKMLKFDEKMYSILKKKYQPEISTEQSANIFCTQIETDNVFENPLTEKCKCNSESFIECYAYFYQKQQDEYKEYLMPALTDDFTDTTLVNESEHVRTQYKRSATGLTINVFFDGGEDKIVFYKENAQIIVDRYMYPD